MTYFDRPAHQRNEVLRVHKAHPEYSAREITFELGVSYASVRSIVSRQKLSMPSFFARRRIVGPLKVKP